MRTSLESSPWQSFSDAVFALSSTLLVVTLEVPDSYTALLESIAGFPAFALAFAALISLWYEHRQFFAQYPLKDNWSVVLNSVLLFIVLLYVYPLKLLSQVVAELMLGAAPTVTIDMGNDEIQGLYLIFGAAAVAVSVVFALLHIRAWQFRDQLALDKFDRFELRQKQRLFAVMVIVAGLSMFTAAVGWGLHWGLPALVYLLTPVVYAVERRLTSDKRQQLLAERQSPDLPSHQTRLP